MAHLLKEVTMPNHRINTFSTSDGWRGIIADSFTFEFVQKLAFALGSYLIDNGHNSTFIGYDTRFMSNEFAKRIYCVYLELGIFPLISRIPIPTPVVSFKTNIDDLFCGINVTASHNPYYYNGIKVRMFYGGPPSRDIINNIERRIANSKIIDVNKNPLYESINPINDYVINLRRLYDFDLFKRKKINLLIDPMYGTTTGILSQVFKNTKVNITEIHNKLDPYFGGISPEPMKSNTTELQRSVKTGNYHLGVAHDGDGDRIIAAIPKQGYLSPHDITAILLWYLVEVRKEKGTVVGSVTLSNRIFNLARHFNLPYKEIAIGFRNASEIMRDERVLIAGEENGGIGFGYYLPERDATVVAMLLIEAEANYRGGIREILTKINKIVRKTGFRRLNIKFSKPPQLLVEYFKNNIPEKIMNHTISSYSKIDGLKLILDTGEWINIRSSGTEDLIRIYTEANSSERALKLAEYIKVLLLKLEKSIK
jgi:phosphomannomutase